MVEQADQIITPEQRFLGVLLNSTQLPIHPRRRIELMQTTEEVLASITHRERRVLQFRFALGEEQKKTLEELGGEFGVTRERIRQIEAKALRKLRHPSRGKKLKNYASIEADSVASSVAGLNDGGFSLVAADLAPLSEVPLAELAEASHLVEFVRWQTSSNWRHTTDMLNAKTNPFFEHLSNMDIATLRGSVTRVYEKAQTGFYHKQEEKPELLAQKMALEGAAKKLIDPNRLFPNIQLTSEDLNEIGFVSIDELKLSTRSYNSLKRSLMFGSRLPILADILSLTQEELLHIVRNFGIASLAELEKQIKSLLDKEPRGERKGTEEVIRETIDRLPEVPAGKYPLSNGERITANRYGAEFTLTRNAIYLQGGKVSIVGLSFSENAKNREKVIHEFTQALGKPNTQIASTKPEEIDFLSWLL